jgi:hypothetical protein
MNLSLVAAVQRNDRTCKPTLLRVRDGASERFCRAIADRNQQGKNRSEPRVP